MIIDLGRGQKCAVARPIHVSSPHTTFGWISSNGLGGDITDRRTEAITIFKRPGDKTDVIWANTLYFGTYLIFC